MARRDVTVRKFNVIAASKSSSPSLLNLLIRQCLPFSPMTYRIRAALTDLVDLFINLFLSSKFQFFATITTSYLRQVSNRAILQYASQRRPTHHTILTYPLASDMHRGLHLRSVADQENEEQEEALFDDSTLFTAFRLRPCRHRSSPHRSLRDQRTSLPYPLKNYGECTVCSHEARA